MSACVVPIPTTTATTTDDHRRPQTIDDTYLTAQVPAFDLHAADFDFPHGKPHRRHRMSMQRRPGEGVDETGLPGVLQTHDRYFQLLAEEPAAQPCDEPRPQRGTGGRRHWIGSRSSSSECEFVSSGSVVRVLACLLTFERREACKRLVGSGEQRPRLLQRDGKEFSTALPGEGHNDLPTPRLSPPSSFLPPPPPSQSVSLLRHPAFEDSRREAGISSAGIVGARVILRDEEGGEEPPIPVAQSPRTPCSALDRLTSR